VDGRNPAPVDTWFIPLFVGFQASKEVQDFFRPHATYGDSPHSHGNFRTTSSKDPNKMGDSVLDHVVYNIQ